jgi:hypothetical protein
MGCSLIENSWLLWSDPAKPPKTRTACFAAPPVKRIVRRLAAAMGLRITNEDVVSCKLCHICSYVL